MNPDVLATILAMAAATFATRLAGFFVPEGFARRGRLKAAFEAMPVAVLGAIITPTVLATGWPEAAAAALVVLAAWRLPLIAAIVTGILAAAAFRAFAG
ncbi:MAG TPA: AzlD domain-containing protein [Rhizobiaceae bacterium]|nr:AzlD domain-containing protein [Rhizobiaceae bacterium]